MPKQVYVWGVGIAVVLAAAVVNHWIRREEVQLATHPNGITPAAMRQVRLLDIGVAVHLPSEPQKRQVRQAIDGFELPVDIYYTSSESAFFSIARTSYPGALLEIYPTDEFMQHSREQFAAQDGLIELRNLRHGGLSGFEMLRKKDDDDTVTRSWWLLNNHDGIVLSINADRDFIHSERAQQFFESLVLLSEDGKPLPLSKFTNRTP